MTTVTKNIIIADDEAAVRKPLNLLFSSAGYIVQLAENGERVQELLNNSLTPSAYDLLILDLDMPVMSGIELLRYYQNTPSEIPPVLVISGTSKRAELEKMDFPIAGMLDKPFDFDELSTLVKQLLKENTN